MKSRLAARLLVVGGVLLVAACSAPAPYVFRVDEFNRDAPGFGRLADDIESVSVCYSKFGTTAQGIREMAQAECGRYDKRAEFRYQDYSSCALMTPSHAVFACVKP